LIRTAEYGFIPILLRVAKPSPVGGGLELCELPHVDAVSSAYRKEFSEFVLPRLTLEMDDESSPAFILITFYTRNSSQPFKERSLVVQMVEDNPSIHMSKFKQRIC